MAQPDILFDGPKDAPFCVALAHGAGAPMDTPYMAAFAEGLAERGYRCARFEFPYMAKRRVGGPKRPPDRAPVLLETWRTVAETLGHERLIVGGKSMGGRMASMFAATAETTDAPVQGIVCLGYPFHAPGRPEKPRINHLKTLRTPALILQGTRDPFGGAAEVATYGLDPAIQVHWLEDGDHGLKPRKASGRTEQQNWDEALDVIAAFLGRL